MHPAESIDYAVAMENSDKAWFVALDFVRIDIGSARPERNVAAKDGNNDFVSDVITESTKNCYLHSDSHLLTTADIDDLVIVATEDAVFVCSKNSRR